MKHTNDTIVLSMIVKNEEAVLADCLASVRPLLSAWVIVDTGSTDRTREIAREVLADVPGEVVDRAWKNFGHNRSEALDIARDRGDYSLVIDADDTLQFAPNLELAPLTLDCYTLPIRYGATSYNRVQLLRNERRWRYEGVIHEYPACDGPTTRGHIADINYIIGRRGARAKDPERFKRDAELIEAALVEEPDNRRYTFYLGQSYRDAQMPEKALEAYARRATMGGWEEEVFYSLLEVAKLHERLRHPFDVVHAAYLRAYESRPRRAEPLYELARYCRFEKRFALACAYASVACETKRPDDSLFVAESVYEWRAKDELAVAAYHTGRFDLGKACNEQLLAASALPDSESKRVRDNLGWCVRAIGNGG
ncbi:MAG: glycosyltransferase [Labilithrix sp.]|nr:glycosyltransferase [Labilithrix sp.]